ncbi:cell wall anchor protein [Methylobacterium sp. GC_Met_2]|uniref:cell wall anchor protein n=1 Tax=Methylobacterium sp. GC_Met_2 TaxID=2937376 RepID=UPI00226B481E|nr:cell wall anchor protein [Methylobacterium sp. GC_Met_2]
MSVNAVSGTSLRHDLVSALRQARAAGIQPIDASGYSTASQDTGSTQGTGASTTAPTSSAATSPPLSSDLMASLLQLQSDFSQMGLQTGVTAGSDADNATSTSGATDAGEAATSSAPVHHHHGHHAPPPEPDAAGQAGTSTDATDASADTSAATGGSSTGGDTGDGLQSLLQHVTKAIAAYAMGGPVGIAASALTSSKA